MRIGHGYDAHAFEKGGQLILGGVEVPHSHGLRAHSDGDVVLHALCDALLGALALGDLGHCFPDDDAQYEGIDSQVLLRRVYEKVLALGYALGNADITVIAQRPRLALFITAMRRNIASVLNVDVSVVSVKATTTEKMGFCGREEGIATHAVVLIKPSE